MSKNPGLGFLLECALNTYDRSDEEKLELFKIIAAHPAAKDIPVSHLQPLLAYAVCGGTCTNGKWKGGNPEIVKALMTLRNASKIPSYGEDSIESALKDAKRIGNKEMIELLASFLPPDEEDAEFVERPQPKQKQDDNCSIQ